MHERNLTQEILIQYEGYLHNMERSSGTIEKYRRDVKMFFLWVSGRSVTRQVAVDWKEYLYGIEYAPTTINSMLAAINGLFRFMGWEDCRVSFYKIQRRIFCDPSKELTRAEYECLLKTAREKKQERLALLLETITATGIRVSEVKYITVEAARQGRTDILLKGKIRTILLPNKLCRKLLKYAKKQKTGSGEIFLTRNGHTLSRRQIWSDLKRVCKDAGVNASKVFPHNLRHLFAKTYYRIYKDIVRLADILGHSSIDTTRIYLLTSGFEQRKQLNRLGLIL